MSSINSRSATTALVFGHIAGMIDLAALPVWVGTLVAGFGYENSQAGGLVTSFLLGVVLSSVALARVFHRMSSRWVAPAGYLISALCFFALSRVSGFAPFLTLHLAAGLATGVALSTTHGTMGKTTNPHRIFAFGHTGFGIFAVIFLGGAPKVIEATGAPMLFVILGGAMAIAAVVTGLFFPRSGTVEAEVEFDAVKRFPPVIWMVILAVLLMNLVQAMTFSFIERIGMDSGYGTERVQIVLLTLGLVNLVPALLAAALEKKLSPLPVGIAGAIVQAVLAVAITASTGFVAYAIPTVFFAFVMIFTHTFLFGFLARTDKTGRAVAATPAMTMSGSAIAPLLGGVLSQAFGYYAIGLLAALIAAVTVTLLARARMASGSLALAAS